MAPEVLKYQIEKSKFDYIKNNKEMAQKWTVVVRKKEDKVNLYCDSCWNDANNMIQEINHDIFTDSENGDYYRLLTPGTYTITAESFGYICQRRLWTS